MYRNNNNLIVLFYRNIYHHRMKIFKDLRPIPLFCE